MMEPNVTTLSTTSKPIVNLPARPSRAYSREIDLALVIFLTVVIFSILYPISFFSKDNLRVILNNLAVDGILAVGMMTLMIAGVFDLSVGSMLSMIGVLTGWLLVKQGWSVATSVAASLLVAALGGLVNGLLVARARVNALITTLGTLGIFQGIAILIAGPSISNLPSGFTTLGQSELLNLQWPVWFMFGLAIVAHYLLRYTRYFRQFYYVGSNAKAARLSGIHVERIQILGFTLSGLIAGTAGLAFAARVGTAVSAAGVGTELRVITAVILGGASLSGGKGSVPGALIGVVFMALINNVLIIARVSSYWQGIVVGVILVLAVALDSYQNKTRK
jgi:ribose/xylose/arabinose/galactoside ABC-type transport system permease subunit